MPKVTFKPLTVDEYPIAERFKRATVMDAMGDGSLFDGWFPVERSYASVLAATQAKDPAASVLAWLDGVAVGQVDLRFKDNGMGHLANIYLVPELRGRGLGDQLDQYAVDFFKVRGVDKMSLKTNPKQPKVVAFYERRGWKMTVEDGYGFVWMMKDIA